MVVETGSLRLNHSLRELVLLVLSVNIRNQRENQIIYLGVLSNPEKYHYKNINNRNMTFTRNFVFSNLKRCVQNCTFSFKKLERERSRNK